MAAKILHLYPPSRPLAGFLRIGHTGQKKLEASHAAGRLPFRRVVFDAAHLTRQRGLLAHLKASGCEIVLDPNFAELATEGRFQSAASRLPWANQERPWRRDDFGPGRNANLACLIAEFAVQYAVNVVLAPAHLLETANDGWRSIDFEFCEALRTELDRAGGPTIAIDYQLITTYAAMRDDHQRPKLIRGIGALPIENVWLRVSGFGAPRGSEQDISSRLPLIFTSLSDLSSPTMSAGCCISGSRFRRRRRCLSRGGPERGLQSNRLEKASWTRRY